MLPESYSDCYTSYKGDTNVFLTWLCSQIRAREDTRSNLPENLSQPRSSTGRLKGRARKEAKLLQTAIKPEPQASTPEVILVSDIVPKVESVLKYKCPLVKVPIFIQTALRRAIVARKALNSWFRTHTSDESNLRSQNSTHEHFIKVLEQAAKLLEPRFQRPQQKNVPDDAKTEPEHKTTVSTPDEGVSNRFKCLEYEDLDDGEVQTLASSVPPLVTDVGCDTQKTTTDKDEIGHSVEIEVDTNEELLHRIYLQYEGLHEFRAYIQKLWKRVAAGECSHLSASLLTEIIWGVSTLSEMAIRREFPGQLVNSSYRTFNSFIYQTPGFDTSIPGFEHLSSAVNDEDTHQDGPQTPKGTLDLVSDEYIFLSTYLSLEKNKYCAESHQGMFSVPSVGEVGSQAPLLKSETKISTSWAAEDLILSQLQLDLRYMKQHDGSPELREHIIGNAIVGIKQGPMIGGISVSLASFAQERIALSSVFGVRIILDILAILGDKAPCLWDDLESFGDTASKALGITWHSVSTPAKPGHLEDIVQSTQELRSAWVSHRNVSTAILTSCRINASTRTISSVKFKERMVEEYLAASTNLSVTLENEDQPGIHTSPEPIMASTDPKFYYRHQPVHCGMQRLGIHLALNSLGIDVANTFGSVVAVAHLYNALHQTKLITTDWKDLDTVIQAHMSNIFKGSLPQTPKQMSDRFMLCCGAPASTFATNRRKAPAIVYGDIWDKCGNILEVIDLVTKVKKFLCEELPALKFLCDFGDSNTQKGRRSNPDKSVSEKLLLIEEAMNGIIPYLETDIVGLTRNCHQLLVDVRLALKEELGITLPCGENISEGTKVLNFQTVLNTLLVYQMGQHDLMETSARVFTRFMDRFNTSNEGTSI